MCPWLGRMNVNKIGNNELSLPRPRHHCDDKDKERREERCCTNLVPFSCSGRRLCLIWREWRGLCQKGRCICFRLTLRQRRWGCLASRSLARFLPTLLLKPAMQWNQRSYLHMTTLDTFSHINHINHISHSSSTLPFLKSTNTISQIQICATQG